MHASSNELVVIRSHHLFLHFLGSESFSNSMAIKGQGMSLFAGMFSIILYLTLLLGALPANFQCTVGRCCGTDLGKAGVQLHALSSRFFLFQHGKMTDEQTQKLLYGISAILETADSKQYAVNVHHLFSWALV
jgi:hypothetical protein